MMMQSFSHFGTPDQAAAYARASSLRDAYVPSTEFMKFASASKAERSGPPTYPSSARIYRVALEEAAAKFHRLKEQWDEGDSLSSNWAEIAMNPAYQSIIGMGRSALPSIAKELRAGSFDWFWALSAITEERPVPYEARGDSQIMLESWLAWLTRQGY